MVQRLKKILHHYQLSAATFADRIGIQRSSMSHILSGRNRPSLDFVKKLVETFPEVDLYWLLYGKGRFPKKDINIATATEMITKDIADPVGIGKATVNPTKVMVFYEDGTFEVFVPKKSP
ncbi:MAG: helix-turn-helix transcriptional regulator [Bacteroidota bacterium]